MGRSMRDAGLIKAINAAGSLSALARHLGVSSAAIAQWETVPLDRVVQVECAIGVPRHELRPDFHLPPAMPLTQAAE